MAATAPAVTRSDQTWDFSWHFEAIEARLLRASFSAFVDVLTLATRTIQEFGQK
ncbi:predicted protein [Arabidopsis lyrata subsp. lyrata]|uniref:Predicted protein n=1 Tax=Arabidopsis lyrata subsp. lyrata TaxID=81972 RepID=D7MWW7_ARALL|nr:predicted protein [Arabidopsis lyrata subsp. lyrata]